MASQHGPQAIHELAPLAGLVEDGKGKAESEQAQIAALNGILDRSYGKPTQAIVGDPKRPITMTVTVDRPPEETLEQWLARRARELAATTAGGTAAGAANGGDSLAEERCP